MQCWQCRKSALNFYSCLLKCIPEPHTTRERMYGLNKMKWKLLVHSHWPFCAPGYAAFTFLNPAAVELQVQSPVRTNKKLYANYILQFWCPPHPRFWHCQDSRTTLQRQAKMVAFWIFNLIQRGRNEGKGCKCFFMSGTRKIDSAKLHIIIVKQKHYL